MGLIKRLFGHGNVATTSHTTQTAPSDREESAWWIQDGDWRKWDAPLSIVAGESHYMPALRAVAGTPRAGGWLVPVEVELVREATSRYDGDAIAVLIGGSKVGYINADACSEIAEVLDTHGGNARLSCLPGLVRGGWPDRPNLGVMLWLNHPDVRDALPGIDWEKMTAAYAAANWPPRPEEGVAIPSASLIRTPSGTRSAPPTRREPRLPPITEHFAAYVEDVKELKRRGRLAEAEQLLLCLIDATEAEAQTERLGVAPWYYEQLAIVRRRVGNLRGEVEILERFAGQPHAPGASPPELLARLTQARAKLQA